MFLGTHAPRLDDKGRLVLPAKFREGFSNDVVLTKGQDLSVVMWPASEFQIYAQRLREASRNDARVRSYLRVFFSSLEPKFFPNFAMIPTSMLILIG